VTGTFVEKGRQVPLADVEIVLRTAADSTVAAHTTTGGDGRFRVDSLRFGRYLLRASLIGYATYTRADIVLSESAPALDLGTLALAVSAIAVKGVDVGTARSTAIVTSDRNIYLAKDLPAAAGTATELLRAVPELDVDINDNVSLRGSTSVTIQLNGRTSPLKGDGLTSFLRQFPASRIERIEVVANPSAKYDPEGMAGIVNIVTKEPLDLGLSGSVYASVGDRSSGSSPRIAWQEGKLTLSGGVSGFWNRYDWRYEDRRQNLLAQPPTSYELNSSNQNRSGFGGLDGSFEYAFDKKATLYGSGNGYLSSNGNDGLSGYLFMDGAQAVTSSYDRATIGDYDWRSGTGTLGFQRVIEKSRNEWTLELRQNESSFDNTSNATQHLLVPVSGTGEVSLLHTDDHSRERSVQLDDTYPLGKKGKLETGYRGAERRSANTSRLSVLSGGSGEGLSDYVHREIFNSGYATIGSTFGRLSAQAGVRAEAANTTFDVIPFATRYRNDYRSAYPSANVAWDFGKGRTLRVTYSKRIERPAAYYLNPNPPAIDTLNRFAGNPFLAPKYTHSYSLEATWQGSRGLLRLAPFYRNTIHNWDQFKTVDATGAAVTTYLNASSVRSFGASIVASLRQTGRFGGTLNLSLYREVHDASNLTQRPQQDATIWTMNGNVTMKATKTLDLQGFARYNPAQTLAQGRVSGTLFSNLGARQKLGESAWASLYVNDPFNLYRFKFTSSDASYTQTRTNHASIRSASLAVGWSWGKPPEPKVRRQPEEQPQQQRPPEGP